MRVEVTVLYCVLTWLSWTPAYTLAIKNCTDCVDIKSCAAARKATEKLSACSLKLPTCVPDLNSQMVDLMSSALCGLDATGLGKMCCAELTAGVDAVLASVDYHPNLSLLPINCGLGEDGLGYRIAGGIPVLGGFDYPWMVFISYKIQPDIEVFQCGGSLINERYVLTAAHCLNNKVTLTVRIREYDVETTSRLSDIPVEEAIFHPGYRRKPVITDDIGLLRLKYPVKPSSTVPGTICLPLTNDLQNRDIIPLGAIIAQRKRIAEENFESAILIYVDVSIHTTQYCQEQYEKNRKHGEEDKMINKTCSDSNAKGACRGVSGGPLMVWSHFGERDRYIQYGIVSYGPNSCGYVLPEVYTDVTKYMTWILDNIKP